ncbi:protein-L-isoaspartate O-methyltransferase family protein [Rhodoferax ferrireducens]|uniref:protein-L-isoaspartate O-methyltransferase family protein n=1 Tax=Rhodoferax ferrireducens TaxID=192843 RepID=UPI000E0D5822|nr:protein-L-isoaspartate O-methyltransferase [Rhodoferax ferrireducens]
MNFEQARFNMIEQQIRPWDVLDADVLHLLSVVKREDFVPLVYRALAFADMEIPLGHGQCMLAPRLEARMLQDAAVQKHEKVLEIGAGSGYMAALLAHRAQRVISLEVNPELAAMARTNLQKAGIHNAEVRQFDGAKGAPAEGPFDVIMLSGSVAEVPQALLANLKVGGRLIAIVGEEPVMRATIVTRTGEADFKTSQPWDTVAPRLLNFPEPSHFHF